MDNAERVLFVQFINTVSDYYQKPHLTGPILEIYFNGLAQYSFDQVKGSVSKHMSDPDSGQFMPKIADIKKHIDGGTISTDEVLSAARAKVTPFGILCRIQVGTFDLEHQTDAFYLKSRAQECLDRLPEWRHKAITGDYTDHEIKTMLKHGVRPDSPFHYGLEGPADIPALSQRLKLIWKRDFVDAPRIEHTELTPEQCKTITEDGKKVLRTIMELIGDDNE